MQFAASTRYAPRCTADAASGADPAAIAGTMAGNITNSHTATKTLKGMLKL